MWEWDIDVSKQSLLSFVRDAGLLTEPGSKGFLKSLDVENIFTGLHRHSSYHGKRAQRLLFPEFCEVLVECVTDVQQALETSNVVCQSWIEIRTVHQKTIKQI